MTLHKSKGLEFDIVFHLDLYNYIIPIFGAIKGNLALEKEDLNLHYVGITRAKKCCYLVTSTQRYNYQSRQLPAEPSNFLFINELSNYRLNNTI
ncbi:MAG TPA: hypothetical protein DDW90_08720 [Cyanobacteria bacterium UBA9971]|nr:hypothetical protein [Cyanobacteria bacterium UBA9971]